MNEIPKRGEKNHESCKYNFGVVCGSQTNCECCGWNQKVAEERKQKAKHKNIRRVVIR